MAIDKIVPGTTNGTAAAGSINEAIDFVNAASAVGTSVLTAATAAAARTAIGAGTSNLAVGTTATTAKAGNYQPTAANISDASAVGRSVLTAADAAAARTAIGAGTGSSNLTIGTTATTAKAGNYQPTAANISDATAVGRSVLTAADQAAARAALGITDAGGTLTPTAAPTIAISDPVDDENVQASFDALIAALKTAGVLT